METNFDLGDALKLAANVTEMANKKDSIMKPNDSSNNTQSNPNQTVQIQVGNGTEAEKPKKPVIIREKPETHIHKDFPDERALTDKECDLALQKAKMENDYKIRQLEYRQFENEQYRQERLRREEQERKDRKEREAKAEKRRKIRAVIAGVIGAAWAGLMGYGIYKDYKAGQANGCVGGCVKGEGSVK